MTTDFAGAFGLRALGGATEDGSVFGYRHVRVSPRSDLTETSASAMRTRGDMHYEVMRGKKMNWRGASGATESRTTPVLCQGLQFWMWTAPLPGALGFRTGLGGGRRFRCRRSRRQSCRPKPTDEPTSLCNTGTCAIPSDAGCRHCLASFGRKTYPAAETGPTMRCCGAPASGGRNTRHQGPGSTFALP